MLGLNLDFGKHQRLLEYTNNLTLWFDGIGYQRCVENIVS